ncbi:MAG: putative phosphotransacetylase [Frankiales bacterium]|jgi:hypothetical protein|nr:putative phosphotransacetylase [Frankiales bacterium]
MSSAWECERHGAVHPFHVVARPGTEPLRQAAAQSGVPLWSPLPLLAGWSITGLGAVGDGRGKAKASVLALSGPSPLGGPADLLLVAEEPGVGLGGRYTGLSMLDPGSATDVPPEAKVEAAGHPTALWRCPSSEDRVAFFGEAMAVWLWAVLWPAAAELVLVEHMVLHDLRHGAHQLIDLPFGAPTPRVSQA